jgi:hypothetical protein
MTHLTMAIRTWNDKISTGGSEATTQRQMVRGSPRPPIRYAWATLKPTVPAPHNSMVVPGQPTDTSSERVTARMIPPRMAASSATRKAASSMSGNAWLIR